MKQKGDLLSFKVNICDEFGSFWTIFQTFAFFTHLISRLLMIQKTGSGGWSSKIRNRPRNLLQKLIHINRIRVKEGPSVSVKLGNDIIALLLNRYFKNNYLNELFWCYFLTFLWNDINFFLFYFDVAAKFKRKVHSCYGSLKWTFFIRKLTYLNATHNVLTNFSWE